MKRTTSYYADPDIIPFVMLSARIHGFMFIRGIFPDIECPSYALRCDHSFLYSGTHQIQTRIPN